MKLRELRDALKWLDGDLTVWIGTNDDEVHVRLISADRTGLHIQIGTEARVYPGEKLIWQEED